MRSLADLVVREHVVGQIDATIICESQHGTETIVRVELLHPVAVTTAEQFVRECPLHVHETFARLGG